MSKFFKAFKRSADDLAASGLDAGKKAAKLDALKKVSAHLEELGGDLAKLDPKVFRKADGLINDDAIQGLKAILRKGGVPKSQRKTLAKTMSGVAEGATDKQVMDAAGESLGDAGKALKDSKSFWEKNKTAFLAAGVSAVGIALATMIAGKKPEEVTGVLKSGDKTDPKDEDDEEDEEDEEDDEDGKKKPRGPRGKAGLVEFFKKYGLYIGIALGFLVFLGVIVFVMSRKSNNTNAPVEPTSV